MGPFKQQWLTWIIISAAAVSVSCQEQGIISTLREGNRACPGEDVIFTCTLRGSLALAWRSPGYIANGSPLQFSTANMIGANVQSRITGNITATATLTTNIMDNGEQVLQSTLRITATVDSMVTCNNISGDIGSIEFSISAVPGVPRMISATEISQPVGTTCVILVEWDPPANSDVSDIGQYIVYVPSRNIRDISFSTISTLIVSNCGDDIRIQVAAMNRDGCMGMNSSEVQLIRLNIPTVATENRSITTVTEGGSAPPGQLGDGAAITIIAIIAIIAVVFIVLIILIICFIIRRNTRKIKGLRESQKLALALKSVEVQTKYPLVDLYFALRRETIENATPENGFLRRTVEALRALLETTKDIRNNLVTSLVILKDEKPDDMQKALDCLIQLIPDMSPINDEFKSDIEQLRNKAELSFKESDKGKLSSENSETLLQKGINKTIAKLHRTHSHNEIESDEGKLSSEETLLQKALDNMIAKVHSTRSDEIKRILLQLCEKFESLLKPSNLKLLPEQEEAVGMFDISLESMKKMEKMLTAEFAESQRSVGEDVQAKMHIHKIPSGNDVGEFLVVDMEANHLVLHMCINDVEEEKFMFDENLMAADENETSENSYLRNFVNDCITKFTKDKKMPIAFTFPFPVKQEESLTSRTLIRWIKRDFESTGGVVQDRDVPLVNDATGILLAMGNKDPNCPIGISLRNRVNACYMEEVDAGDSKIINTELGTFNDDGKLDKWWTKYDHTKERVNIDGQLDDNPSNSKQQLFEKMISEDYQGLIICRVIKDLHKENKLFGKQKVTNFDKFEAFCRRSLGIIEVWDIETCKRLLKRHLGIEASYKDYVVICRVCVAVSTRAAKLAAAGIVALVKKINKIDGCTVAVDSTLNNQHPQFLKRIQVALDELEPGNKIKIKPIDYGSRRSANFAAAMLQYCVSPPPSSSPGSSEGSEGQRGQQEDICVQSDAAEEHAAAKNLISANVEVHPQPAGENIELPDVKS